MSFEISPFTFLFKRQFCELQSLYADAKMQTYGPKSFSSGAFSFQGAFLFGLNLDPICAFMCVRKITSTLLQKAAGELLFFRFSHTHEFQQCRI
jgi:hypothetical protein